MYYVNGIHQNKLTKFGIYLNNLIKPITVLQTPSVKPQALLTGALGDDRMNLESEKYDNNNI